jgi:hypothetical protein
MLMSMTMIGHAHRVPVAEQTRRKTVMAAGFAVIPIAR